MRDMPREDMTKFSLFHQVMTYCLGEDQYTIEGDRMIENWAIGRIPRWAKSKDMMFKDIDKLVGKPDAHEDKQIIPILDGIARAALGNEFCDPRSLRHTTVWWAEKMVPIIRSIVGQFPFKPFGMALAESIEYAMFTRSHDTMKNVFEMGMKDLREHLAIARAAAEEAQPKNRVLIASLAAVTFVATPDTIISGVPYSYAYAVHRLSSYALDNTVPPDTAVMEQQARQWQAAMIPLLLHQGLLNRRPAPPSPTPKTFVPAFSNN